jgi:hypothetical protein
MAGCLDGGVYSFRDFCTIDFPFVNKSEDGVELLLRKYFEHAPVRSYVPKPFTLLSSHSQGANDSAASPLIQHRPSFRINETKNVTPRNLPS